mmetsp:Transcript_19037/g.45986  ORF Transcript_19037/g.45986 Transcript_19037/m.45986 type:complete len:229 (-) Transcript_19037:983-1669(-)
MTNPFCTSSVPAPDSLTRTFSPGRAPATGSSLAQTESTLYLLRVGIKVTFIPGRIIPLSTLPIAMVPRSTYLSRMGIRSGAFGSRPWISRESRRPSNVGTDVLLAPVVQHSFHHGQMDGSTSSLTLDPARPEIGMNLTSRLMVNPHPFKNGRSFVTHSSYRVFDQLTVGSSILLTTTTRKLTPSVLASMACSRVWPPRSKPVSNSPFRAEMTRTPTSAWLAPMIMFGT